MCFQGFVYYGCGHSTIIEHECGLADDQAFYIKFECPDYQTQRAHPNQQCGLGKFYCKQTWPGRILEEIYQKSDQLELDISNTDARLARLAVVQASFMQSADRAGVSLEARTRHRAYGQLLGLQNELDATRNGLENHRVDMMAKMRKAINDYTNHKKQSYLNVGENPGPTYQSVMTNQYMAGPPVPWVGHHSTYDVAPTLGANVVVPPISGAITANSINVSNHEQSQPGSSMFNETDTRGGTMGENIYVSPNPGSHAARLREQSRRTLPGQAGGFDVPSYPQQEVVDPDRKQSGGRRGTTGQATPDKSPRKAGTSKKARLTRTDSSVRRSTRVRDKKVSYAESDGSDGQFRELSPDKSDASGFSPSKSDVSESPTKSDAAHKQHIRELRQETDELEDKKSSRGGSSLGSLIGDWQRRSGVGGRGDRRKASAGMTSNTVQYETPVVAQAGHHLPPQPARLTSMTTKTTGTPTLAEYMSRLESSKPPADTMATPDQSMAQPAYYGQHTHYENPLVVPMTRLDPSMAQPGHYRQHTHRPFFNHAGMTTPDARPPTRHGPPDQTLFSVHANSMTLPRPAALPNFLPSMPAQSVQPNVFNAYANQAQDLSPTNYSLDHPTNSYGGLPTNPSVDVSRSWLVNTPAAHTLPSNGPVGATDRCFVPQQDYSLPNGRHDSVVDVAGSVDYQNKENEAMKGFDYDRMRRSFSATTDLTPPANMDFQSASSEPKKRRVAASSPSQPSNKRIRLSLPGEDVTPDKEGGYLLHGGGNSLSSPPQMSLEQYQHRDEHGQNTTASAGEDVLAAPAPILAPTAFMYVPVQDHKDGEHSHGAADAELPGLFGEQQLEDAYDASNGDLNQFSSDIDWIVANDELN